MARNEQYYDDLISFLMRNVESAADIKDITDNKQLAKMLGNIDSMIVQMGDTLTKEASKGLTDSFFTAIEEARGQLKDNGVSVSGGSVFKGNEVRAEFKTQANVNALQQVMMDTMLDLEAAFRTARNEGIGNILDTVAGIKEDIAKGILMGSNREAVVARVKDTITNGGLTGFTTVDGKRLPIDFYARTVVRTKTQSARNKAHIKTYNDADVRLITVEGGKPTCGRCSAYRGITFDTSGKDSRFAYLDFETTFPLHPNCKCVALPFVEEYKTQQEVDDAIMDSIMFDEKQDRRDDTDKREYNIRMKKQRVARQEEREYKRMKDLLGPDAPKTIGAFRRMKRYNPDAYNELRRKVRRTPGFYPLKKRTTKKVTQNTTATAAGTRESINMLRKMQFSNEIRSQVKKEDLDFFVKKLEDGKDISGFDDYVALMNHHMPELIVEHKEKGGAHFNPNVNRVVMNLNDLQKLKTSGGKRWGSGYETFQHETAHYIAGNVLRGRGMQQTKHSFKMFNELSQHYEIDGKTLGQQIFEEIDAKVVALQKETNKKLKAAGKSARVKKDQARELLYVQMTKDKTLYEHSTFDDIFEGAARGNFKRNQVGHGKAYWSKSRDNIKEHEMLAAEGFAHFSTLYIEPEGGKILLEHLPESKKFYDKLLKAAREELGI